MESGLGASTVTISQAGAVILVKVVHGTLIHCYAARSGENNVYKNAALMTYAHPFDARAASWTGNFIVGTSSASSFPCYFWKGVNDGPLVHFRLTAAQAAAAHTPRIGLTTNYAGGRFQVTVNDWTSSVPAAPSEPKTRTMTVGGYRGNNVTYTYSVPASAWKTDTSRCNVLKLSVVSGDSGTGYLSPGVSVGCLDLLAQRLAGPARRCSAAVRSGGRG